MECRNNKKIKILMVLPVLGQPRHAKRIDMLIDSGFDVEILAFDRDWPKGRMPKLPVHIIGHIEHRQYLRRLPMLVKAYRMIKDCAFEYELIYCFGHDLAYISALASRGSGTKIALEVGDIQDIQMRNSLIGVSSRLIDQLMLKNVSLLALISEGFVSFYINRLQYSNTCLIIENKIEPGSIPISRAEFIRQQEHKASNDRISIGYFGVIRDKWGLLVLERLAKYYKYRFDILFAGCVLEQKEIDRILLQNKNTRYLGSYRSPQDLAEIYSKVDLIWACYPPFPEYDVNHLSGRPNRFYEACYFGIPIIARKSVAFANDIEKYAIGKVIGTVDVDETVHQLKEITGTDLRLWRDNMKKLSDSVFMLVDEPDRLRDEIVKLCL